MKLIRIASLLVLGAFMSLQVFAGTGKAVVSHWYAYSFEGNTQNSNIFISNITQNNLKVTVTLYNKDGTIKTSGLEYKNFQNNNTEIGARKSVNLKITGGSISEYGYAVIEWGNIGTDDDTVGLVAWADWAQDSPSRAYSVQVNNGNPF